MLKIHQFFGARCELPGINDIHNGDTNTVGALLITIAATRLTEAGLDFPKDNLVEEPELTLYARLQEERNDAYSYYNALLNRLNSFCHALELINKYRAPDNSDTPGLLLEKT